MSGHAASGIVSLIVAGVAVSLAAGSVFAGVALVEFGVFLICLGLDLAR